MKKFLHSILFVFVLSISQVPVSFADTCATGLMPLFTSYQAAKLCSYFSAGTIGTVANNTFVTARNAAGSANLNIWKADASDNTVLNAGSNKVITFSNALTPVAQIDSQGLQMMSVTAGLQWDTAVLTPATNLTPVAGTNDVARFSVVATACPTNAAVDLIAAPNDGDVYEVYNPGANPLIVAALGTPVVNYGTNRRISLAAKSGTKCTYSANGASWLCELKTLPTPAA